MRADKSGYIIFSCVGLPIILLHIIATVRQITVYHADTRQALLSGLEVVSFMIALLGFVFLWLSAFKLVITNAEICYKSLFSRAHCLSLHDIQYAKHVIGDYKDGNVFKPFVRIELHCNSVVNKRVMMINVKIFRLNDIRKLKQLLEDNDIRFVK